MGGSVDLPYAVALDLAKTSEALGITPCDLMQLAAVYKAGATLNFAKQSNL